MISQMNSTDYLKKNNYYQFYTIFSQNFKKNTSKLIVVQQYHDNKSRKAYRGGGGNYNQTTLMNTDTHTHPQKN